MNKINALFLGAALALSGCATLKPELTQEGYTRYAETWLFVDYCAWKGWISLETAADGKHLIQTNMQQYSMDLHKFNGEVLRLNEVSVAPDQNTCSQVATVVNDWKRYREQNKVVEVDYQAIDILNKITPQIKHAFCTGIGSSFSCATY